MRQLQPTGRLCFRETFSMSGKKRIAQRLIDEWSTDTPRSSHHFYMDASLLQGIFNAAQTRKVAFLYPALCVANTTGPDEIR
ncbi:MAG: hypothetical protein H7315_04285 [Herminiimonas sp.]|nr:hypothetical protein [Herminiimonas sp.]